MQNPVYHIPALLNECIEGLNIRPDGIYVDVTFGGGGHSREILKRLNSRGHLYGFDQDADAERNILQDNRFTFVRSNFRFLKNFMHYHGVEDIDGLLADLGVSFHHFDDSERGFSFRFGGKLDMRMNNRAGLSAADILNNYEEEKLADLFYLYGELKTARKIAVAIVKKRCEKKISDIDDFLEIIRPFINRKQEKKELAQLFQALRIEVNHEMDSLRKMLMQASELLKPGGRIAILTYHSLEDRLVKNFFKTGNFEGKVDKDFFGKVNTPFRLVNNKVIAPSEKEVEQNPRSRSAKLRIAEKI
ncbi:16S rRNA (cytosine(1402)-N(4))-methyltransferase RsmH [Coprobacter sp.]